MSKPPAPWRSVFNNLAALFGRTCVSERRLAALEDRIARFDGGDKATEAMAKAVGKHNAEYRGDASAPYRISAAKLKRD